MDPDSELITATAVTPANTADAQPAPEFINDLLNTAEDADTADTAEDAEDADTADTAEGAEDSGTADTAEGGGVVEEFAGRPTVYGDSAYGSGEFQGLLQQSRINSRCRTGGSHFGAAVRAAHGPHDRVLESRRRTGARRANEAARRRVHRHRGGRVPRVRDPR